MLCPVRICKHEGKQKYLYKMRRRAGSAPAPSPRSVAGAVGGGGGAGGSCPAWDLEQGRGDLCLVSWAGLIRGWIWQIYTATLYGRFIWQIFIWRVCLAGQTGSFTQGLKARKHCKANEIERNGIYMVDL